MDGPGDKQPLVRVAAVQAAPVFLNREATIAKATALLSQAAHHGAQLVVFPESFVPCYPVWLWGRRADVEAHAFARLYANAVDVPGACTARLSEAARSTGVALAIGVSERESTYSRGTLYNTLLVFDANGELVLHHRKLMPTYKERTVWGQGDGSSLATVELNGARTGGLLCWENLMPLARQALYAQGEQVHLAPTADTGGSSACASGPAGSAGRSRFPARPDAARPFPSPSRPRPEAPRAWQCRSQKCNDPAQAGIMARFVVGSTAGRSPSGCS